MGLLCPYVLFMGLTLNTFVHIFRVSVVPFENWYEIYVHPLLNHIFQLHGALNGHTLTVIVAFLYVLFKLSHVSHKRGLLLSMKDFMIIHLGVVEIFQYGYI